MRTHHNIYMNVDMEMNVYLHSHIHIRLIIHHTTIFEIDDMNISILITTDSSRHFTFTTETDYVYVEYGSNYPGTYTYNGSIGSFYEPEDPEPINFRVNGDILITDQNDEEETLYKKQ